MILNDELDKKVKAISDLIEWIASQEGVPDDIKASVIAKANRYLNALNGDIESANEIFAETQFPNEGRTHDEENNIKQTRDHSC